jgi:hypothetical protein
MSSVISGVLTVVILLGIGIWCLTQARRIQRRVIESNDNANLNLFRNYVKSGSYLVVTRIIGGACIVIAILLGYTIVRR